MRETYPIDHKGCIVPVYYYIKINCNYIH